MIDIEDLTFQYQVAAPIFEHFSWQAEAGEAWAVLGASGCGKTTLLYLLAGLVQPVQGRISICGSPLSRPRPHTGLILQDYGLLPWATLRENVRLGLSIRGFYGPDGLHAPRNEPVQSAEVQVEGWLERLGLIPVAEQFPGHVSGGQRQRAAIARTLALDPDLLLMDEPFASLDAPTRETLQNLVLQLRRENGLTTLLVTHSIEEALYLGEKILVLQPGPNRHAQVICNPFSGTSRPADAAAYMDLSGRLRLALEERRP